MHADPADVLAGLPPPVPDDLPGPAPAPQGGLPWAHNSLGASVHNALAAWWRLPLSGRSVTAAGERLQSAWISQGFADEAQSARAAARRPARWWSPTSRRWTLATSRWVWSGRSRPVPTASPCPGASTAWTSGPRASRAPSLWWWTTRPGVTCSPPTAPAARSPWLSTPRPRPTRCGARATGSSCTICPPGACSVGGSRTSRWRGRFAGPRTSPLSAARPSAAFRGGLVLAQPAQVFPPRPGARLWLVWSPAALRRWHRGLADRRPWDGIAE